MTVTVLTAEVEEVELQTKAYGEQQKYSSTNSKLWLVVRLIPRRCKSRLGETRCFGEGKKASFSRRESNPLSSRHEPSHYIG